jgi:ribosome-associated protein YbcJ (S4-like RNA binding protein)
MNPRETVLDLTDPACNGAYAVHADDRAGLADAAVETGLPFVRIELVDCDDKDALLRRIGAALEFPPGSGHNWDALSDRLRDLDWLSLDAGLVLLFDHADHFHAVAEDDHDVLLDVLADAAAAWAERGLPFFAFLAGELDAEDAVEAPPEDASAGADANAAPDIVFVIEGEYVELNQLLKLVGLADSGGAGKALVASGAVAVDGERELRKTCKIHAGQRVSVDGIRIDVRSD